MLRSLSSGVAGMKAHQTRLDVIGNNISNVNTYGFKSSRTTFSSVYYQTTTAAKASTAINGGGVNSNQIGYGSQVMGIDVLMSRSGFTSTGQSTDLAIAGEGFFQVMDGSGNIYYTRNGAFKFDSNGYLVDSNGNYVLGVNGSTLGIDATNIPIKVNLESIDPATGSYTDKINGKTFSITATNKMEDANITFTFSEGKAANFQDPEDKIVATVTNGQIAITVNPDATFADMTEFNSAMNEAITLAYGGEHPAGIFTVDMPDAFRDALTGAAIPLTGKEICSTDYSVQYGTVDTTDVMKMYGITVNTVGSEFAGAKTDGTQNTAKFEVTKTTDAATNKNTYTITYTLNDDKTYTRTFDESITSSTVKLSRNGATDTDDYIVVNIPTFEDFEKKFASATPDTTAKNIEAKNSKLSDALGLSTSSYQLSGGTVGGLQTISDLTNIAIASDGAITATHPTLGTIEIGTICLATFANPAGLDQASSTYFTVSANSGEAIITYAGENGSGTLQSSALEMSNVDLSTEMADMITTERGFQAASRMITVSDEILQELINLKR